MKKILFIFGLCLCMTVRPAFCEEKSEVTQQASEVKQVDNNAPAATEEIQSKADETSEADNAQGNVEEKPLDEKDMVHYGYEQMGEIKYLELDENEDDLVTDTNVKPLNKKMSHEERIEPDNTDFSVLNDETDLPPLQCSDEKLKQQVEHYIYQTINRQGTSSALEKRERILLVKNLHNFKEVESEDVVGKNKYEALAAVMELKVNRKLPVYRICASKGNDYDKFESVYLVLYKHQGYYKVVVSNLMPTLNKMDEATFIYNW